MASRWSGPSFDPAEAARPRPDRAVDPAGYFNHVDASAKEKFVAIEKTKILKEKVKRCYIQEGVNHLENCKEVVAAYLESLNGVGIYTINNKFSSKNKPGIPA